MKAIAKVNIYIHLDAKICYFHMHVLSYLIILCNRTDSKDTTPENKIYIHYNVLYTSGGEPMKDLTKSKEELMRASKPLKELTELTGFNNLDAFKEVLTPLKDIFKDKGIEGLGALKDIATPVKDVSGAEPINGKGGKDGKDSKDGKDDKDGKGEKDGKEKKD
jgi:hypothetical protein